MFNNVDKIISLKKRKQQILNKIIYFSTLLSSILLLTSIVSIAFFTWYKADDFSLINQINKLGILHHVIKSYLGWDGRAIIAGTIQSLFLKYLPVEMINLIWIMCLVLTALVSFRLFILLSKLKNKFLITDYIIGTALFSAVLWYGFKSHIGETVYWATGGAYSLTLLLATIWLYLWITFFSTQLKINKLIQILYYLFTIFAGALTQNLSCALLTYIGIELIKFIATKNYIIVRRIIILIALLIIGTLIIVLAPGNFVRSAYGLNSFTLSLSAMSFNFIRTLILYIKLSIPLFIMLLISIPLIFILISNTSIYIFRIIIRIKIKKEYYINMNKRIIRKCLFHIVSLFQFLLAAIATIIPFILLPDFASTRTSLFFMAFVFFWVYFQIIPLILLKTFTSSALNKFYDGMHIHNLWITSFLLCIFLIVSSHIISLNLIKNKVLAREALIKAFTNKNVDVTIYPIDKRGLPFSYSFDDIAQDKTNWINQAVSDYFNLKSITVNNIYEKKSRGD